MTAKEQLHALVDELTEEEAEKLLALLLRLRREGKLTARKAVPEAGGTALPFEP